MVEIKGKSIRIKTFTREEYHQMWQQYAPDPVMDPRPYRYDMDAVNKGFDLIEARKDWYPRAGIFLLDGTPIGELAWKRVNRERSQCELGIFLANDSFKGKGYGTEAMEFAVAHAFDVLELTRVYVDTMSTNIRMQRILNRLGFKVVGQEEHSAEIHRRKLSYLLTKPSASPQPC